MKKTPFLLFYWPFSSPLLVVIWTIVPLSLYSCLLALQWRNDLPTAVRTSFWLEFKTPQETLHVSTGLSLALLLHLAQDDRLRFMSHFIKLKMKVRLKELLEAVNLPAIHTDEAK